MTMQEILDANSRFLRKYRKLKPPSSNGWAIVTCCDRRLSGLLEAAMGFRPGEAHVIRNAGNTVAPFDNSVIRSLSLLFLTEGVRNIAVVGHTGCRAGTDSSNLTRVMKDAGIDRQMAGSDLRDFYGLSGDPSANIRNTVDRIVGSGLLPAGISVIGLLMATETGKLLPICERTITKADIPYLFDKSAYGTTGDARGLKVTTVEKVRGQEEVRQHKGSIEVPRQVRTPVKSVKVPVNIRTPVREVKVPDKVTVHKSAIDVPAEVRMPEGTIDLGRVEKELSQILDAQEPGKRRSRELELLRGQSEGSWDPGRRRRLRPVLDDRDKEKHRHEYRRQSQDGHRRRR